MGLPELYFVVLRCIVTRQQAKIESKSIQEAAERRILQEHPVPVFRVDRTSALSESFTQSRSPLPYTSPRRSGARPSKSPSIFDAIDMAASMAVAEQSNLRKNKSPKASASPRFKSSSRRNSVSLLQIHMYAL